jgi:methyl-accepting chemotaxis protein
VTKPLKETAKWETEKISTTTFHPILSDSVQHPLTDFAHRLEKRMSIKKRIYLGMGILIAITLTVGGFAAYKTNQLVYSFEGFRETSEVTLLAGDMSEQLLNSRVAALMFRTTGDPKHLAAKKESLDKIYSIGDELNILIAGTPEQEEMVTIRETLDKYEQATGAVAVLIDRRNTLVAEAEALSSKSRQQLVEIMETSFRDGDPQASFVAAQTATDLQSALLYLEKFLVTNDPAVFEKSIQPIKEAKSRMDDLLLALQNPRRRELAEATVTDLARFTEIKNEIDDVILQRNDLDAQAQELGTTSLDMMNSALAAIVARQETLGDTGIAKAKLTIFVVAGFVLAGTLIGAILAFVTGSMISRSLSKVTEEMKELADGNLDLQIEATKETHEIGKMTNAMVVFLENARKARDLDLEVKENEKRERERQLAEQAREAELAKEQKAKEERERDAQHARMKMLENFQNDMERVLGDAASGNFANRMSNDVADKDLAGLANVINRLLEATDTNIADIMASIDELAKGNLGIRIEGDRQGAFLRMKENFNAALKTLSATMATIMHSGHIVSSTSSELEKSSLTMAGRAETNAAALEETSAAVEEITASVRQVVTNAKAAEEATLKVRSNAEKTREVADETETSINEMSDASAQINRVVKVIEDIAFQINLLALNAGVEAARAGEAGRGFSVVASEVRALAQRSQEAVQEIGQVIDRNNQSVETSVEKVRLSRSALESIISEVVVASNQISEIAVAVEQQSMGIEEVNTAIRSIDTTTQTNAASLEEMTAASVSLSEEANSLASALNQFHGVDGAARESAEAKVVSLQKSSPLSSERRPKKAAVAGGSREIDPGWEEF